MNSTKIDPKYITKSNPRIGLIALASDFMIERDFINVIKDREVDFFVNRIECYTPLTKENLIKMSDKVTEVTKDILPDQDIDGVVYGHKQHNRYPDQVIYLLLPLLLCLTF